MEVLRIEGRAPVKEEVEGPKDAGVAASSRASGSKDVPRAVPSTEESVADVELDKEEEASSASYEEVEIDEEEPEEETFGIPPGWRGTPEARQKMKQMVAELEELRKDWDGGRRELWTEGRVRSPAEEDASEVVEEEARSQEVQGPVPDTADDHASEGSRVDYSPSADHQQPAEEETKEEKKEEKAVDMAVEEGSAEAPVAGEEPRFEDLTAGGVSSKEESHSFPDAERLARAWSRKAQKGGVRAVEQALAAATAREIRDGLTMSSQAATLAQNSSDGSQASGAREERLAGLIKASAEAYASNKVLRARLGAEQVKAGEKPAYDYAADMSELREEGRDRRSLAIAVAERSRKPSAAPEGKDSRHTAALEAKAAGESSKSYARLADEARSRVRAAQHRKLRAEPREAQKRLEREEARLQEGASSHRLARGSQWAPDEGLEELEYPWGSWVCTGCTTVNKPDSWYCEGYVKGERCGNPFTGKWAPSKKVPTKAEKEQRQSKFKSQLARALALAKWECWRCWNANVVSRRKCWKCSAPRPAEPRGDDSSDTSSDRGERIAQSLKSLGGRRKRKRGGQKHKPGRKKACRCGKSHRRGRATPRVRSGKKAGIAVLAIQQITRWWALHVPRKNRNKLQHTKFGNGSLSLGVGQVAKLLLLAGLVPLAWRAEQEAEEVITAVSEVTQQTIVELEGLSTDLIRMFGRIAAVGLLTIGAVILWFLARAAANRAMRTVHGNTTLPCRLLEYKEGNSMWQVQGSKNAHNVWVSASGQAACACRGFLAEGVCGHTESALDGYRSLGLNSKGSKKEHQVRFEDRPQARARGVAALAALGSETAASQEGLCFTGVVKKAQRIWNQKKTPSFLEETTKEVGCFGKKASNSPDPAVKVCDSRPSDADVGWTACQSMFLGDGAWFSQFVSALQDLRAGKAFVRAYSFDQPEVVREIKHALSRHCRITVVADQSQAAGRTKAQLQVLKELQAAGARIKLASGREVNQAYKDDNRSVRVGAGIKGLHHAKSAYVVNGSNDEVKIFCGSCNFTTSSKSNRECGILLKIPSEACLVAIEWLRDFDEAFGTAISIEEFEERSHQRQQAQQQRSENYRGQ